ncbi:unnamed protein product [Pieris macdunnoughi]|uniref:Uncharacterized protein n=1 Tax=Pieris macdunnoughi TaxID=345717 RepID=A0A821RG28_9NEOP|nr:unnamed protein product [Pieris macdunnoughi]
MRLVGCLLLPTDIRACLYEPGMGEGRIQPWIQPWAWSRQAHHSRQPTRPLVMREPCYIVHSHSLIWQHCHFILFEFKTDSKRAHFKIRIRGPFHITQFSPETVSQLTCRK